MLQVEAKKRQAHGQTAPGRTLPVKTAEASSINENNELKGDTRDIAAKPVGLPVRLKPLGAERFFPGPIIRKSQDLSPFFLGGVAVNLVSMAWLNMFSVR